MIKRYLDTLRQDMSSHSSMMKALLLFSFFLSFALLSPVIGIILEIVPPVKDFSSHIISNAAFNDLDIATRLSYFYRAIFGTAVFGVLIFMGLHRISIKKAIVAYPEQAVRLLATTSTIGLATVMCGIFVLNFDFALAFLIVLGIATLLELRRADNQMGTSGVFWSVLASFPFSIFLYQLFQKKYLALLPPKITMSHVKLHIDTRVIAYFIVLLGLTLIARQILSAYNKKTAIATPARLELLFKATLPLLLILPVHSAALEFFNIINVRVNYVFNSPFLLFIFVAVLALAFSWMRFGKLSRNTSEIEVRTVISKLYFPLTILGIGMMIAQPWRAMQPENEIFEFANHGLSVDHFFRYGKIPLLETFDAHMLSNELFAYVYGFLNGYEPWAAFLYVSYIQVISTLVIFYVLKKMMGNTHAFLVTLCFPLLVVLGNEYVMCGLLGLAFLAVLKEGSRRNFYLFWAAALFLCLFRLDLGFAGFVSALVCYFGIKLVAGNGYHFKRFVTTAAIFFGSFGAIVLVLCVIKGINPASRLMEFLAVAMSNQNWGYKEVGDQGSIVFHLMYDFLPLAMCGLLAFVILKSILATSFFTSKLNDKKAFAALALFLFFTVAYFLNLPRGIVRHTLHFDMTNTIVGTVAFALAAFIYIDKRRRNLSYFLVVMSTLYLGSSLKKESMEFQGVSAFGSAITAGNYAEKFQDAFAFNGTRTHVIFSQAEVGHFKRILDKLLKPGETYYDFASANYYYALVNRENPVYVNQSPLLLNGDKMQLSTIETLKSKNIQVVLMPKKDVKWSTIDGIRVDFKYYLISEYIYEHYEPVLTLESFDIYVLKSKYKAFAALLEEDLKGGASPLWISDFTFFNTAPLEKNNLDVALNPDKSVTLTAKGNDPLVRGFFNQIQVPESINKESPVTLSFKFHTEMPGSIQLFYQMPEEGAFTEEKSKRFPIVSPDNTLVLDLKAFPKDIRIDIDTPSATLQSLQVYNTLQSNQLVPPALDYDLGFIPQVWGDSDSSIFKSVAGTPDANPKNAAILNLKPFKKQPAYLYFEAEADTVYNGKAEFFNGKNERLLGYQFFTKKGRHHYAIRISPNYHWYHSDMAKAIVTFEAPTKFYKLAITSDKGQTLVSGNEVSALTLSNITDENWFGGVGLKQNMLLIDNAPQTLQLLKGAKHIVFADGSKATIAGVSEAGAYIHVNINEEAVGFKAVGAFPNMIKTEK